MLKRWFEQLSPYTPSLVPLIICVIALGLFVLGMLFAVVYGIGAYDGITSYTNFGFVAGFLVIPFTVLLIEVAAFWERKMLAKFLFGLCALVLLVIGAVIGATAFGSDPEIEDFGYPAVAVIVTCFGPFILLTAILPIYALVRLPGSLRRRRAAVQEKQALEFIRARRGEVAYGELGEYLRIRRPEPVDELLQHLVDTGQIRGVRKPEYSRFYTASALLNCRRMLLGMVESRGAVALDDLARELEVPTGLVKEWLYELVREGKFTGYLNWDEEIIYSAEAGKLRSTGRCPNCQAPLALAGKGVVRCSHCDTEILLSAGGGDAAARADAG